MSGRPGYRGVRGSGSGRRPRWTGSPGEFLAETAAMPGGVTHVWIPGCTHDTRPAHDAAVTAAVRNWLAESTG